MPALRTRLVVGTALLAGLVTAGTGAAGWAMARSALLDEFDAGLAMQLHALAAKIEHRGEQLRVELDIADFPELMRAERPDLAAVWDADGTLLVISPAAVGHWRRRPSAQGRAHEHELPGDQPGRRLSRLVAPGGRGDAPAVTVSVARNAGNLHDRLERLAWVLAAASAVGSLLAAAGMAVLVPVLLRPLQRLSERIASVDPATPAAVGAAGLAELEPAVRTLDALLARLTALRERERGFIGDAAHELRTPLAAVRASLEAATGGGPRDDAAWRSAANAALAEVARLQRTVDDLLALARLDAGAGPGAAAPVDLAGVVRQRWDLLAGQAAARGLVAHLELPDAEVVGNEARLDGMVRNLLANAVAHGDPGALDIDLSPHEGGWRLRVANPCAHLHADDAERVFQRFWRADAARGEGHAGLGLAIVRRLAELSGCRIAVAIAGGRFTATLDVPARPANMPACPPTESPSTAS
jgi:signal transduction histidine kinase